MLLGFVVLGFVLFGCSGTTTVNQTASEKSTTELSATEQSTTEQADANQTTSEPTPVDAADTRAEVAPPTPGPDATAVVPEPAETESANPATAALPSATSGALLGISHDGGAAFIGVRDPWNDAPECDGEATESLIAIDVLASAEDDQLALATAGLEIAGVVNQMVFDDNAAAILWSCGPEAERRYFVQHAPIDGQGTIVGASSAAEVVVSAGERRPTMVRFVSSTTVQVLVILDSQADDPFQSTRFDHREISLLTGEVLGTESLLKLDGEQFPGSSFTSPDGRYTYRSIDDPNGRIGCEGSLTARTLEVSDESGSRLALGPDGVLMASISDVRFGPDGLIAWRNGCVQNTNPTVGRIQDDGIIVDGHHLGTFFTPIGADEPESARYQFFALSTDGHLVGLGGSGGGGGGGIGINLDADNVRLFRYDLAADPQFVESADPQIQVDWDNPLGTSLDGTSTWYVGDTLGAEPACGASTLYADTTTGLARALRPGVELDRIVDIEVSDTRRVERAGADFDSRVVVLETECPGDYPGRRVWFDISERDNIRDGGLAPSWADLTDVADVLAVYEVVAPGDLRAQSIVAKIEWLDGTVSDVELIAAP